MLCGVDEAGRGPLAGPVYAAAVVFGANHGVNGLADSKKLSARRRDQLALAIKDRAIAWYIASASAAEIDELNILQATLLAMRRAIEGLAKAPDEVLVDGLFVPKIAMPARAVVRGDSSVAEISAASILAKTARDVHMLALHAEFPCYGFDRHKGYPTAAHLAALREHGISREHRRSFAPVRALIPAGVSA
jgi:ribonuclease HII